jgi:hypothetical protein
MNIDQGRQNELHFGGYTCTDQKILNVQAVKRFPEHYKKETILNYLRAETDKLTMLAIESGGSFVFYDKDGIYGLISNIVDFGGYSVGNEDDGLVKLKKVSLSFENGFLVNGLNNGEVKKYKMVEVGLAAESGLTLVIKGDGSEILHGVENNAKPNRFKLIKESLGRFNYKGVPWKVNVT